LQFSLQAASPDTFGYTPVEVEAFVHAHLEIEPKLKSEIFLVSSDFLTKLMLDAAKQVFRGLGGKRSKCLKLV